MFVESSSLTRLLPHQFLLPLSSSTLSLKFYFLFHRPEHNVTLLTTLLSQYPGIPCCLPIHTFLFYHIHQPLLFFQLLFSKPFYFFLPSNSHKKRSKPHRSPPVRTTVIRIHHSERIVSFSITTPNKSGGTRAGPHVQLSQHDHPLIPAHLTGDHPSASFQEEWFDRWSTNPGAWKHHRGQQTHYTSVRSCYCRGKQSSSSTAVPSCSGRLVYISATQLTPSGDCSS